MKYRSWSSKEYEWSKQEEKIKAKLVEEQAEQLSLLHKELNEKSEKVKALNLSLIEIEKLKREKAEIKEAVEAEAQIKINETLIAEREKIKKSEEMVTIEKKDENFLFEIQGLHKLWTLKSQLIIPAAHIIKAYKKNS